MWTTPPLLLPDHRCSSLPSDEASVSPLPPHISTSPSVPRPNPAAGGAVAVVNATGAALSPVNGVVIGGEREVSQRIFEGVAGPWRAASSMVSIPGDPEPACAWLGTTVEASSEQPDSYACGLLHLWRSDLYAHHVLLLGHCQLVVVVMGMDELALSVGRRLLDELAAIHPTVDVLLAAVHSSRSLGPEPDDVMAALEELDTSNLEVIVLEESSRLDHHRLAYAIQLAARRAGRRLPLPPDALDWSRGAPHPSLFGPVAPPEENEAHERSRKGQLMAGPAASVSGRRQAVVDCEPAAAKYQAPDVTAAMAASIAAAIESTNEVPAAAPSAREEKVSSTPPEPDVVPNTPRPEPRKRGLIRSALGL